MAGNLIAFAMGNPVLVYMTNMTRIALQPAYVLHHRAYRDTSLLVDLFTLHHGRITLIARGVRKNRSQSRSLLQPFIPLLISYQGRSELMMLTAVEVNGTYSPLRGNCLLSGFYLNELLMRLLQKQDPYPELYSIYEKTLLDLQSSYLQEKILRLFEKKLLEKLGYALQLSHDFKTGELIADERHYEYYPDRGFTWQKEPAVGSIRFKGNTLLALAKEQLDDDAILREVKRLMRLALMPLLGPDPLQSRKLFA